MNDNKSYPVRTRENFYKSLEIGEEKIIQGDFGPLYHAPEISPEEEELIQELKGRIDGEVSIEKAIEAIGDLIMSNEEKKRIAELVVNEVSGYGPLQPLLDDDEIEEIMVIGLNSPVYIYHRRHGMCETNLLFKDAAKIESIICNIFSKTKNFRINRINDTHPSLMFKNGQIAKTTRRNVDASHPLLETRLPDGSRVNATLSTVSLAGPTITIRKFMADPFTIVDLIKLGTVDAEVAALLWFVVEGLRHEAGNILISGGTGSGKTTLLNCLAIFIPARERVITIEDTVELQLPVKHKIALETRPPYTGGEEITPDMLLKNALRMRPDRIIVNEVRGEETMTLFTAMNTGHHGCMGTIHANSARDTLTRLTNPPMNVPLIMVPAMDLIIMQNTVNNVEGTIRMVTEIAEVAGVEGEKVLLNNIYEWDPKENIIKPTGTPSTLKQKIASKVGWSGKMINAELETRELFLEYMVREDISKQEDVYKWIQEYYKDPEKVLNNI
jgi:flagellar protein FlaI